MVLGKLKNLEKRVAALEKEAQERQGETNIEVFATSLQQFLKEECKRDHLCT